MIRDALAVALALIHPAHSWYPYRCCNDVDCHPVENVAEVEGGYWVEGVFIERWRAEPSQDGQFHICNVGRTVICFFAPQNS